ncbi:MAG: triose-phosphate isomerase [Deltaproteobacteria bacterium]|jgi:triosephosphate isomerase|nr:triose-phosphate isomerase [Deltaproteobacteria bacterium]
MKRKLHVYGNWKLHNKIRESEELAKAVKEGSVKYKNKVNIGVAPVYTSLINVRNILGDNSTVKLLAQNGYPKPKGAFTGEVSFPLLKDAGCRGVIIGHSERRHLFNESNELISEKVESALQTGLDVTLCLGETLEQRENGETWQVIEKQLTSSMFHVPPTYREKLVIAYEPVWAIGTGKTATPEQAQEVHAQIRNKLEKSWLKDTSEKIAILYGGSVKPKNAKSLFEQPDIDGALVGGASLDPESFLKIIDIASHL